MGIKSTKLKSGDVFFVQDDGVLNWYSRLCQAGDAMAGRLDLVPTHCGIFFRWDPYTRPGLTTHLVYNNLELSNIQGKTCVECNDPFIRICKPGNCPGIMGVTRPVLVSSATTQFTITPGYDSNRAEWFFSQVMCNQMKAIGKTDYDYGYCAANFVSGLGLLTLNPIMFALGEIRKQVVSDNRYLCSTWIVTVLLTLAAYRYSVGDLWWADSNTPMPGPVLGGYPNVPPTSKMFENVVMTTAYNNKTVCTPWLLKNQLFGKYYVGTYGQGLLYGATQTAKLGKWC